MLPRSRRAIWMRNVSMRVMTRWPIRNVVAPCTSTTVGGVVIAAATLAAAMVILAGCARGPRSRRSRHSLSASLVTAETASIRT